MEWNWKVRGLALLAVAEERGGSRWRMVRGLVFQGGGLVGDWDGGVEVGARDGVCVGCWKRGVLGHAPIHCRLPNPLVYGFGLLETVLGHIWYGLLWIQLLLTQLL